MDKLSDIVRELSERLADESDYDSYLMPRLEILFKEFLEQEQYDMEEWYERTN